MVRTENFDREQALLAAVGVFWKQGYGGTSVQGLVNAMGLHRAHLYEMFGSKEDLFTEVVATYSRLVLDTTFQPLGGSGDFPSDSPALPRLEEFLQGFEEALRDPDHAGCLVEAALVTYGEDLGRAREACLDHLSRVDAKLGEAVRAGQAQGGVRDDVPSEDLVAILRGAMAGMICASAVAQAGSGPRAIREGAVRALAH
jgi:TetR/AcrR family transcriptional repressor of nem operon